MRNYKILKRTRDTNPMSLSQTRIYSRIFSQNDIWKWCVKEDSSAFRIVRKSVVFRSQDFFWIAHEKIYWVGPGVVVNFKHFYISIWLHFEITASIFLSVWEEHSVRKQNHGSKKLKNGGTNLSSFIAKLAISTVLSLKP